MSRSRIDELTRAAHSLDPASIDALYGLEPVFEPGSDVASGELGVFI